jgi:cytochrome bd-type quinol oxidase subunit 2
MADIKKHCSGYGFLGAFTAIVCAVAWFLVNSKDGECARQSYDQLQTYHIIAIVGGIVLCVCGFFNMAGSLKDIIIAFYIATIVIAAIGALMAYAAYYSFWHPCTAALGFLPIDSQLGAERSVFKAEDGKMIAVFILNICAALMMFSASGNFYRMS